MAFLRLAGLPSIGKSPRNGVDYTSDFLGQTITTVIYRYPISVGSGMSNYQVVTINDDEDIDGMFGVYNQHQCLSGF
ncbi:hypothetical protein JHK87_016097 [Glycine soja]|nr:hypothetical protein JHK87_016097 [Glycine soja]